MNPVPHLPWNKRLLLLPAVLAVPIVLGIGCDDGATASATSSDSASARDDHDHAGHSDDESSGDEHDGHDEGESGHDDHDDHAHGDEDDDEHGDEHTDEVTLTAEAIETYGVEVAAVEARALSAVVTAPARVGFDTEAMAHVGSLVAGRVAEINAKLGDRVEIGDVLLVVQSPELGQLQADYLAAVSSADAAKPAIELARSTFDRAQQLYDQTEGGGVTLNTVQEREAALKSAQRELINAESQVTASANTLRLHGMSDAQINELADSKKVDPTYNVVAPIAGDVIEREVTPGELVAPDNDALLVIADLSTVWVLADVAEARLGQVGVGSAATVEVTATGGEAFEGEVTYVDPRVNEASRTARLRIVVDNADRQLRPGMFARALIGSASGDGERMPAVPASAVMEVEGEPSVFVPVDGEPNTFARRGVLLGERVGDHFPVIDGVQLGDEIVVGGTFILKAEIGKAGVEHAH